MTVERGRPGDGDNQQPVECARCDGLGIEQLLDYCRCGSGKRRREHDHPIFADAAEAAAEASTDQGSDT